MCHPDKLFGVDDREFLHDSTINSDLSSRVLRMIDKHKEDIKAGELGQGQPGDPQAAGVCS
jgi:hypothetical protein